MLARFDYLRMNFLLERLSTEREGTSRRTLLEVAREMLDLTVFLWLERDRSANRKHDYDFNVRNQTVAFTQTPLTLPADHVLRHAFHWNLMHALPETSQ